MIGEILAVIGFGAAYIGADAAGRRKRQSLPAPHEVDMLTLIGYIERLHSTAQRIRTLDRMITDIELCDPDTLRKNFSMMWDSGGENRDYHFWTSGADINAEHLIRMAMDEKEQLMTSLVAQIDKISTVRCTKNERKTLFREADHAAGEKALLLHREEAQRNG